MDPTHVKRLFDAKASPRWCQGGMQTTEAYIIGANDMRVLRVLFAVTSESELTRVLHHAISSLQMPSATWLIEWGVPYKHLMSVMEKKTANETPSYRASIADFFARFVAREERCKQASCSLLSAPVRALLGRDLARLLAEAVWQGHRNKGWDQ